MEQNLNCAIVKDLLPSYTDGLTSEETNRAVEEHLAFCADCTASLNAMREKENAPSEEIRQVNYLKKIKKRHIAAVAVSMALVFILAITASLIRIYAVGWQVKSDCIDCAAEVDGRRVTLSGRVLYGRYAFARAAEKDGVLTFTFYGAPRQNYLWDNFRKNYTAKEDFRQIKVGNRIVWEDGQPISELAAALYRMKTPYVGDMSQNAKVAGALNISGCLGVFTNRLQTQAEPYGWTLVFKDEAYPNWFLEYAKELMTAYSYMMMAAIGNLSYVTWEYKTEQGEEALTVTAEEATAAVGRDIKLCNKTASDFEWLLQKEPLYVLQNEFSEKWRDYTSDGYGIILN